jgi:K+-sensing histidine kinase KdpD
VLLAIALATALSPAQAFDKLKALQGDDRSGLGLGLAISRKGREGHRPRHPYRNLPGKGCIFAIELPIATL